MNTQPPACDVCGSVTVRTGDEWHCIQCGNKMKIGTTPKPSDVSLLAQARALAREAVEADAKAHAILAGKRYTRDDLAVIDGLMDRRDAAKGKLLALLTEEKP